MRATEPAIARVLAAVAVVALAWAAWLSIGPGLDTHIGGVHVTSRDAMAPLVLGLLALLGAMAAGDRDRLRTRLARTIARVHAPSVAAALAIGVAIVASVYATTAASGSDSFGYASQANAWLAHGSPVLDAPHIDAPPWPDAPATLAPLGYHAVNQPRGWTLVPTYAPGLPLLMAAAKRVLGEDGLFAISPVAGALLVYLTFLLGRLLHSPAVGVVAAWLLATSAMVLGAAVWPMSDVPAAACWTGVFFLLQRRRRGDAIAAGLVTSLAIAIRPNLLLLGLACALPLVIAARRERGARVDLLAYAIAASPAPLAIAWTNGAWYGAATHSGYGPPSDLFKWIRVLPNLRHYGRWLVEAQGPLIAGLLLALLLGARWRRPERPGARLAGAAVFAALCISYLPYFEFDDWTYLRFFLPCWPLVAIAAAACFVALARAPRALAAIAGVWLVLSVGLVDWRLSDRLGAFSAWRGERRAVLVGERLRDLTDPRGVVFSLIYSGSARYYGGRETIRYDLLDAAWLDRAVHWLSDHGAHPYLLAERWEIDDVRVRFSTQTTVTALDRAPMLALTGDAPVVLIDLAPDARAAATLTLSDSALDARDLRAAPPAPLPTTPWR